MNKKMFSSVCKVTFSFSEFSNLKVDVQVRQMQFPFQFALINRIFEKVECYECVLEIYLESNQW